MACLSLLFPGACARVVDEDPAGNRSSPSLLRTLPRTEAEVLATVPIGAAVQVLYGPHIGPTRQGATTWWVVRVLAGPAQDRVGWMVEMAPGTEYYSLREVRCPPEVM